jgi:His-Xaa-Ser system protein HxsD
MTVESSNLTQVRLLRLDLPVYGLTAILKSAYLFTDRAYLHIQRAGTEHLEVRIRPKGPDGSPDALAGEFLNDLLDQRLREIIGQETQQARDLILAHALTKTNLLAEHRP